MPNSLDQEEYNAGRVKHDIRNQLSNISLAVEQLKYELTDPTGDANFYISTITAGCTRINELLDNIN